MASFRAELAELALDAAPDGLLVVDSGGLVVLSNRQAAAMFGYSAEELHGQPVENLVPYDARDIHPHHRARYFASPQTRPMGAGTALTGLRKDGTAFPVDIALSALHVDGEVLACAAVRDVSDRQRVEAKYRALLDAAPDAIVGVDPAGVIRLANRQAEVLFGYPREELVGATLDMLVPDRAREAHPAYREEYFRNPRTRPMGAGMKLAARRKDGTEFPVDIALSYLDTDEGPLATAVARDISEQWAWAEQSRLQAQLHQAQRLESLGQLAGGIAHDFNNLLAVILNYASFVHDALAGDDARGDVLDDVEQIRRAAERAAALTRRLLMFGRREVVQPEVLDLNAIVGDLQSLLRRTLGEHVEVVVRQDAGLWPVVADPSQVEQVLVNLAVNARDAMPGGGRLVIETANVTLDEDAVALHTGPAPRPGPYVRLTVSDSGSGMTPETVERAFDPFFTTKPRGQGSGLGLATVYGIVTDAGGHVSLYSDIGTGTTFRIYLPPAADAAVDRRPVTPAASVRGAGETILVAEDEDPVREIVVRILTRGGYRVLAARGGEDALAHLADPAQPVDLLLTDVVMPGLSGPELSEQAAALRAGLPVLFMSGYSHELMPHRVLPPGVWLVEKPFTADTLLARVREVLVHAH